jgi:hypothetical protein
MSQTEPEKEIENIYEETNKKLTELSELQKKITAKYIDKENEEKITKLKEKLTK